ncbi:MAG TPA: thioredoxin family protein [bacterium]|nr:thioredoxin family protein [bacterium]
MKRLLFSLVALFLVFSSARADTEIRGDHVQIRLVPLPPLSDRSPAFGIEFRIDPDWHIYWRNPGDSGAAPKFKVEAKGGQVRGPEWPAPERIPYGTLTNYGYNRRVLFPFQAQLNPGSDELDLTIGLEWLVCKVDCIPGFGKLATVLRPDAAVPAPAADPAHPLPQADAGWSLGRRSDGGNSARFELRNAKVDLKNLREVDLFPLNGELFATRAPSFQIDGEALRVEIAWAANAKRDTAPIDFLLSYREGDKPRQATILTAGPAPAAERSLAQALLFALLGGLLLNLMPCVFPVLSIKALSLAREAHDRRALRHAGLSYGAGVLLAFGLLGGLLLLLRAGGQALGWGFQLQSPLFVFAMALLFFAIGLNFLEFFELGNSWARWAGRLQGRDSRRSAFGTGLLATLIATPCTAPFMGSALGFSLLLPSWQALLIFLALGLGMALPLLGLCYFPWWTRHLPKPGPWMQRLREFFAFPMFLTAVWLGWVLVRQAGNEAALALGAAAVGLALALWIFRWGEGRWGFRIVGALFLAASLILPAIALRSGSERRAMAESSPWLPFQENSLREAAAQGRPVFVDFTASWCITCQWNKKTVLEKTETLKLFRDHGLLLLRADWTDQDPVITRALAAQGRNSVPLYLFQNEKGEVKLLPELLSFSDLQNLFKEPPL